MKNYRGNTELVSRSAQEVFEFVSDFRHFEHFLPEQITDWEANEEYCIFAVTGLGKVKMVFHSREPYHKVVVQPATDSGFPVPFFLSLLIHQQENKPDESTFQFEIEAEVNPMIAMMVDRPLKQFVEVITLRLKTQLNNGQ